MQNDNIAQTIKENYKTYAEERLVPIEALREIYSRKACGTCTEKGASSMKRHIKETIVLSFPLWFILLMVAYWLKFGYVL